MKKLQLLISTLLFLFTLQEATALGRAMKASYRPGLASSTSNNESGSLPAPTPGEVWDHL
ncbi:MAG: hypothetical protein R3A80_14075 [Bdellovibrionota bacterium]